MCLRIAAPALRAFFGDAQGPYDLRARGNRKRGSIVRVENGRVVGQLKVNGDPAKALQELVEVMLGHGLEIAHVDGQDEEVPVGVGDADWSKL